MAGGEWVGGRKELNGPDIHIPRRFWTVLETFQRKIAAKQPDLKL